MLIYKSGDSLTDKFIVMLGMFDGIHLGHKSLIDKALEISKSKGIKTLLYTFETNFKSNNRAIMTKEAKILFCEKLGIDAMLFEDFTDDFKKMSPESFLDYLKNKINAVVVVCGENYRFGYNHKGDAKLLEKGDFESEIVPSFYMNNAVVSSSAIRGFLENGDIKSANMMLGYNFFVCGKVAQGRQIGRELGFKTANIMPNEEIVLPKDGVYATKTTVLNKEYTSVTNIGVNPTFNLDYKTVETHILDFDGDIYGLDISIEFCEFLRAEKAFSSKEELSKQILIDVSNAIEATRG